MSYLADKKIVIIGLGLIGGSIAKALMQRDLCREIVAVGRNENVLQAALVQGDITGYSTDPVVACSNADLIILAVPVLSIPEQLRELKPVLPATAVLTDVASVKAAVVDMVRNEFGLVPANFVPGHPIAGSEQSGYVAAKSQLFAGRKVILTPLEHTSSTAVALVTELWELLGTEVLTMDIQKHDEVLAATSHLPHLLAFALVDTLTQQGESEEIFRYGAGGFRDFTRIASSDPVMWRDIFLTNGEATVTILDKYISELLRLRAALVTKDATLLFDTFQRAKLSRDKFLKQLQQTIPQG